VLAEPDFMEMAELEETAAPETQAVLAVLVE
jgi:hypothetical protein